MTDRDRLIELVCDKIQDGHCIGHCNYPPCNQCKELADHLITNDVIVQKQGEWVSCGIDNNDMEIIKCSECGRKQFGYSKFCATCGAKMDLEE